MILKLAFASDCRYIVTHNVRHFAGAAKLGIQPITPRDFLALLRKANKP